MYKDGTLRGSEVSEDSYHFPVKKIKKLTNHKPKNKSMLYNLCLKVTTVAHYTMCCGKLFQAFTLRHTDELKRQFTLQ